MQSISSVDAEHRQRQCSALLGHVIAEWGTQSTPIVNYVNNGKRQEWAAEEAAAVQQ
jgi:hypothetical protein